MDNKSYNIRVPKRWARIAMIVGSTALIVAPLTAVATHTFDDVPNSHTFHGDITWLADAGVTKGCNPPANTNFCPDDNVTRGQMGAFMRRLAEGQVVDAGQLDGQDPTAYTTGVWAESCGIQASGNPPNLVTSCVPDNGGVLPASVAVEVFSVQVSVPVAGALQLSSNATTIASTAWSFTLNETCNSNLATFINRSVNGQYWGSDGDTGGAAHFTTNISAGTHTLRLCGRNLSPTDPTDLATAAMTAQWTAGGSVTVAGSGSAPVDALGLTGG